MGIESTCIQPGAGDGFGDNAREVGGAKRWNQTLVALASMSQGRAVDGTVVHAWLASWGDSSEFPLPKFPA